MAALVTVAGSAPARPLAAQGAESSGIRAVGRFDPASGETTYEVAEPLGGREVFAVQRALLRAGVSPGVLDGRLGPATRSALERFQRERGLRPCACVSDETVLALGLELRVTRVVVGPAGAGPSAGASVRVIRPRGIVAETGASGPAPAGRAGAGRATEEGAREEGARVLTGPGTPGFWVPVIVPVGPPIPGPGGEGTPTSRPAPRGATPPGIRPPPPPRVTPPPGSAPRSRPPPRRGGSGGAV